MISIILLAIFAITAIECIGAAIWFAVYIAVRTSKWIKRQKE